MDYVYQYKDHLGNVRLTYKDDQLYDTDFNNGSYSPWTKSENTTSMTIEGKRLKVITGVHLNGANGYYNLLAGETYEISLDVDRSLFTTDLEFSLWNGNSKIYGEYVTTSKTVTMNYTPTISATYRINLRLRDYGYAGGPQTFYLDNVIIRKTALAIIEENNYYPFGLKHQGYNNIVNSNANAVAGKFKYNGKELNDELGLDLYDYGARFYDPTGVHFTTIDPYAESYYSLTPYGYCAGNPVKNIDVNGKFIGTIIGTVVGAATGAYDSYKKGGDVWAGATEGAVSGAIAGAAVDLVVAATIATGGGALVVIGAGAAAGAVGGAVGAVAGDATGQVVSSVNKGNSVSDAVSNISTANMADKAKTGAITGTIGGTVGAGVAKGLQAVTKATYAIQSTMAKSITEVSKALPAADGATINGVQKTIERGIEALGKSTSSTVTKTSVSTGMATESAIQVGQRIKEDEKP